MVSLLSILELTTSRTLAASTMGAQLASMRDRQPSDDWKATRTKYKPQPNEPDELLLTAQSSGSSASGQVFNELPMAVRYLAQGEVLRCYDALLIDGPKVDGPWGKVYPSLGKVRIMSGLAMGYITIQVLRVHQEFGVRDPARGLVKLYRWMGEVAPKIYPALVGTEDELIAAFKDATNKEAKVAKQLASEVYADALLAADTHVQAWNAAPKSKRVKAVAKAS